MTEREGVSVRALTFLEAKKQDASSRRPGRSLRLVGVPAALLAFAAVAMVQGTAQKSLTASYIGQREAAEDAQQADAERRYLPALQAAKRALSASNYLNAFREFAGQTDCHEAQVAHILNGGIAQASCLGSIYPLRAGRERIEGFINGQSVSFEYSWPLKMEGAAGAITSRITVQPVAGGSQAGSAESPAAMLVRSRGSDFANQLAQRGRCAAVSYETTGSVTHKTGDYLQGTEITSTVYGDAVSGVFAACADQAGSLRPVP